jgi:hydroxymethylglutaryl-CoA lyase
MLERAGIETGLDFPAMVAANHWLAGVMGRTLPGMAAQAPAFPAVLQ